MSILCAYYMTISAQTYTHARTQLDKFQHTLIDYITYIFYFLYAAIAIGVSTQAVHYLDILTYFTKLYVSMFLVYRFNPFRKVVMTSLDAKIAFNAGLFLLTTTLFNTTLRTYIRYTTQSDLLNDFIANTDKKNNQDATSVN